MKTAFKLIAAGCLLFSALFQAKSQGYIVPNGVVDLGPVGSRGYGILVMHDPDHFYYTGFDLKPQGGNTFLFNPVVDVSVRVFFVSANQPVSLQPILANSYVELSGNQVFANGVPFYLGLYTGNVQFAPPDGIYNNPLFGWARLVNNNGVIQVLNSALEYGGGGILAGTQNIIPVPEPSSLALIALGVFSLWCQRRRQLP